jgi:hypothetical protein
MDSCTLSQNPQVWIFPSVIISHPCTVNKHTSYLNSFLFIHSNSDKTIRGFEEGYCWPQFPSVIGLQNEDCPAYYRSNKE